MKVAAGFWAMHLIARDAKRYKRHELYNAEKACALGRWPEVPDFDVFGPAAKNRQDMRFGRYFRLMSSA